MVKYTEALENIGLTAKEAQIYLALAELGSASATELIRKTGLHRAVVYDLLERLIEKGLAAYVFKGKKKYFEAASPARLLDLQKEKQEKLQEVIRHLNEFSSFTSRLEVKIYKGKEGLKAVFEGLLAQKPKEWLILGSSGMTKQSLPFYMEHFQARRAKLGINTKALMIDSKLGRDRGEELSHFPATTIRYLPKNVTTPSVILIYGHRTILHSNKSDPPFVIVIENKDITSSFKEYFEALWTISR